jgi:hypothetical protein
MARQKGSIRAMDFSDFLDQGPQQQQKGLEAYLMLLLGTLRPVGSEIFAEIFRTDGAPRRSV